MIFSTEDWINKTFPRNISDTIEIKSLNSLSEGGEKIISEERKKLDELILQFHKQTVETAKDAITLEKIFQKVGGEAYNPKLLTRGYLLYEFYE